MPEFRSFPLIFSKGCIIQRDDTGLFFLFIGFMKSTRLAIRLLDLDSLLWLQCRQPYRVTLPIANGSPHRVPGFRLYIVLSRMTMNSYKIIVVTC